jgi:hypothetical protein
MTQTPRPVVVKLNGHRRQGILYPVSSDNHNILLELVPVVPGGSAQLIFWGYQAEELHTALTEGSDLSSLEPWYSEYSPDEAAARVINTVSYEHSDNPSSDRQDLTDYQKEFGFGSPVFRVGEYPIDP